MTEQNIINAVWSKGIIVEGMDSSLVRKDPCGAWIMRNQYGNRESDYGWEIDHVYPVSLGGDDQIDNLRPMQWENNIKKGDDYPGYLTAVIASENTNIHQDGQFTVNQALQGVLKRLYNIN